MSRFPAAFRPPAFASRVIPHPPRDSAFLTVGLPGRPSRPGPLRGYHVPHDRDATGVGASSTPGTAVLSRRSDLLRRRLPLLSGQSLHSAKTSHQAKLTITRHRSEVHVLHPSGLLLACGPWMEQGPSGFPRGSAPRRYQRRTPEWRQAQSTDPELRCRRHQSVLPPRILSIRATSCRTGNSC